MNGTINQRTKDIVYFFSIIILFSLTGFVATNAALDVSDAIYDGIFIGDIPVGGLSINEAKSKILKNQTANSTIFLTYKTQKWSIDTKDIDLDIDADNLAQQAYNIGRIGNIAKRLQERYVAVNHGYTIPLALNYNHVKLQGVFNAIADAIYSNPQNALLKYQNFEITIQPEKIGYKVDLEKTWADFNDILNIHIPLTLELTVNEIPPKILSKDLAGIDGLLSIYTTQFDPYSQNRSKNISLAAQNINNILVRPGEIFSFNKNVGERLSENGYKEAPVLIDGKLVLDWGGGVCQVSSTLYNAALLADMSIEERTAHFRPPAYVPLGQDAAVADNLLDFKFKNTTDHNIYITTEVLNREIVVQIFGKNNPILSDIRIVGTNKKVLEPNTIIKQDPTLELGKEVVEYEGERGFQVTTYRIKVANGKEIKREHLAYDEFKAEDKVVRIGTKMLSNKIAK
ncbi:MAG: VanW family protein [Pelosinus sp.]|jgi:vancomycin resistance protein YoaR|nr:VanW family protein [Pelosinus sp.]